MKWLNKFRKSCKKQIFSWNFYKICVPTHDFTGISHLIEPKIQFLRQINKEWHYETGIISLILVRLLLEEHFQSSYKSLYNISIPQNFISYWKLQHSVCRNVPSVIYTIIYQCMMEISYSQCLNFCSTLVSYKQTQENYICTTFIDSPYLCTSLV